MKKILKQGIEIIVDDDVFTILKKKKVCLHNSLPSKKWYPYIYDNNLVIPLGRFILNAPKNKYVDHINGDTLDNRKSNLRLCTCSENGCNRKISINNKSGYKGVIIIGKNKWSASINKNYKQYYLGIFNNPIEAAKAYDKKAKELFGEFANLNFKDK